MWVMMSSSTCRSVISRPLEVLMLLSRSALVRLAPAARTFSIDFFSNDTICALSVIFSDSGVSPSMGGNPRKLGIRLLLTTTCMYTSATERTPGLGRQEYLPAGIASARSTSFWPTLSISATYSARNPAGAAGAAFMTMTCVLVVVGAWPNAAAEAHRTAARDKRTLFIIASSVTGWKSWAPPSPAESSPPGPPG